MEKIEVHPAEKEAKYLSILVIVVGIILIIHTFLPANLYTKILMDVIITFLIASGISFWFRAKKRNR
jgi:nicotinamide riboside transporter PnuC